MWLDHEVGGVEVGRTIGRAKMGSEGPLQDLAVLGEGERHWENPAGIHGRAPQLGLWGQGRG